MYAPGKSSFNASISRAEININAKRKRQRKNLYYKKVITIRTDLKE